MEEILTQQQAEEFTQKEIATALEMLRGDKFLKEMVEEDTVFIPQASVEPSWNLVSEQCLSDHNSDKPNLRRAALESARLATLRRSGNYEPRDYQHPEKLGGIAVTSVRLPSNKRIAFFIASPVRLPKLT